MMMKVCWLCCALSASMFGCSGSGAATSDGSGTGGSFPFVEAGGAAGGSTAGMGGSGLVPLTTGGVGSLGGVTGAGGIIPGPGGAFSGGGIGAGGAFSGGAPGVGGASGSAGVMSDGGTNGSGGGGGGAGPETGTLPPIADPGQKGPFTPITEANVGPQSGYTAIHPQELGQNGLHHPIVIWGDGAVMSPPLYKTLLDHLASHGFAILAYNATPQAAQMTAAIDWMIAENGRQGSSYAGKLDTTKVASMGHSAGSVATFQIAADPRLTTTMHLNGGTFDPHTDLANLKKPAAFACGEPGGDGLFVGDVARPNCDIDFQRATTPVWYGVVKGSAHMTISSGAATDPMMSQGYLAATAGWLRWLLAGDQTMKRFFVGPSCDLCTRASVWTVQQKNLM